MTQDNPRSEIPKDTVEEMFEEALSTVTGYYGEGTGVGVHDELMEKFKQALTTLREDCDTSYSRGYKQGKFDAEMDSEQGRDAKAREMVERILKLAPGFENTKTGEVTYDVGVQEYIARIEAIAQSTV
jgi:hypothetical protein